MKKIQIIQNLYDSARLRAFRSDAGIGVASLKRQGRQVYSVKFNQRYGLVELIHYGTTTIRYDLNHHSLLYWYGESVSDRDSMNTFLSCVGDNENYFRYGPVMGFIHEFRERAYF